MQCRWIPALASPIQKCYTARASGQQWCLRDSWEFQDWHHKPRNSSAWFHLDSVISNFLRKEWCEKHTSCSTVCLDCDEQLLFIISKVFRVSNFTWVFTVNKNLATFHLGCSSTVTNRCLYKPWGRYCDCWTTQSIIVLSSSLYDFFFNNP